MSTPASAIETHQERPVAPSDVEMHSSLTPGTALSKCDTKTSGLRNTTHLHAEHDIGKLRVLQSGNGHDTMAKKYAMSVMAASVAETVTYPLDLTKTRYCITELTPFPYAKVKNVMCSHAKNMEIIDILPLQAAASRRNSFW